MNATSTGPDASNKVYAVGDVHGCPGMLWALLALIVADHLASGGVGRPRLVLLGDLLDRGPDSRGVVELVMSAWFAQTFDATVLRGNHEDMFNESVERPWAALDWLRSAGGAETVESYGVEFGRQGPDEVMERFVHLLPQHHRQYLRTLPFQLRLPGLFFAHAGVDPGHSLAYQSPMDLMWIRGPFLRYRGNFGALVVHGHTTTRDQSVEVHKNRIAVDTGCGFAGGRLSAAVLDASGFVRSLSVGPPPPGQLDLPYTPPGHQAPDYAGDACVQGALRSGSGMTNPHDLEAMGVAD